MVERIIFFKGSFSFYFAAGFEAQDLLQDEDDGC